MVLQRGAFHKSKPSSGSLFLGTSRGVLLEAQGEIVFFDRDLGQFIPFQDLYHLFQYFIQAVLNSEL